MRQPTVAPTWAPKSGTGLELMIRSFGCPLHDPMVCAGLTLALIRAHAAHSVTSNNDASG